MWWEERRGGGEAKRNKEKRDRKRQEKGRNKGSEVVNTGKGGLGEKRGKVHIILMVTVSRIRSSSSTLFGSVISYCACGCVRECRTIYASQIVVTIFFFLFGCFQAKMHIIITIVIMIILYNFLVLLSSLPLS